MPAKLFSTTPIIKHSIATPLTNILFNSELAIENIRKNKTNYCPESELSSVMMNAKYIESLLFLSDKQQTYLFSPQKALFELIKMNDQTKLKKSLVSRVSLPFKKFLVGNKLLFQEILVCLLNNAFESYQKNTTNKLVFLSAIEENEKCLISIVDGGRGMNWWEKNLASLPFNSTKQKHSGLGLFFAKQTIEKDFKGKIIIKSQKNKGTTVEVTLPFYRGQVDSQSLS